MYFPNERFRIINWQRVTAGMLFLLLCGYFIVYAAQFLRSAHDADFVAVFVNVRAVFAVIWPLVFQPTEALHINHIAGL